MTKAIIRNIIALLVIVAMAVIGQYFIERDDKKAVVKFQIKFNISATTNSGGLK